MTPSQRELLVRTLADVAKGALLAAAVGLLTDKAPLSGALVVTAGAVLVYGIAHLLAGRQGERDE